MFVNWHLIGYALILIGNWTTTDPEIAHWSGLVIHCGYWLLMLGSFLPSIQLVRFIRMIFIFASVLMMTTCVITETDEVIHIISFPCKNDKLMQAYLHNNQDVKYRHIFQSM